MALVVDGNLAHKRRPGGGAGALFACWVVLILLHKGEAPAGTRNVEPSATPAVDQPVPPPIRPLEIQPPPMPQAPGAGKGRLAWMIAGNRRWCTYPDDRLIKPPERPSLYEDNKKKEEVYTFGYRFSIAAVKRGDAGSPLVLFESPTYRTAEWRLASKVGLGTTPGVTGPKVGVPGQQVRKPGSMTKGYNARVPFWNEAYRCVTFPEEMDFDLDPGTYDVYIAFDLLNREGGWAHRMNSFLTDIPIEATHRTRLDGTISAGSGAQRQVELEGSTVESTGDPAAGAGP